MLAVTKKRLWIAALCVAGIVVVYLLVYAQQFRADWAVKTAKKHLKLNDVRSAALGIQRALDLMPDHLEALRLKGNMLNEFKDPEAIEIWTRIAELTGNRTNWCIALAISLQMGRPELSARAAEHVARNYPDDPDSVRLLVAHSLLRNDLPRARTLLQKLGTLDSSNVWDQFNRATLTLVDKDSPKKAQAEAELLKLASHPEVAAPAYRVLIDRSLVRNDHQLAANYSEKLIRVPGSLWSDRFDHIRHQWSVDPQAGRASLDEVLKLKPTDEQLVQLARRLVDWEIPEATKRVLPQISDAVRNTPRVIVIEAEMMSRERRWQELLATLSLPDRPGNDPMLEIYRVRANRELGRARPASEHAEFARTLSRQKPDLQTQLANLLFQWGWPDDAATILMQQALEHRNPLPAIRRLAAYYQEKGATTRLGLVLDRWLSVEPNSLNVKNNYASIHLLLDENLKRAHALAAEVATLAPTNEVYRSTYLFSLVKLGDCEGVLKELPKMSSSAPASTALYQALAHSTCGSTNPVPSLLATAAREKLLPEELRILKDLTKRSQ